MFVKRLTVNLRKWDNITDDFADKWQKVDIFLVKGLRRNKRVENSDRNSGFDQPS